MTGYDIERHDYGTGGYPGQLVIQDVLMLHGRQFKDATVIVASPPCQAYSYRAMPWKRAKALPPPSNELFDACFRIQSEACEAAGHYIPLIVENVCGAQRWVGPAAWHFGSFFLWGDVPALMPETFKAAKNDGSGWRDNGMLKSCNRMVPDGRKLNGSRSNSRKAASAMIAKIPFPLAQHIARTFKPEQKSMLVSEETEFTESIVKATGREG